MFLGCPLSISFVRSFVYLVRYLKNSLNNFDKTDKEYALVLCGSGFSSVGSVSVWFWIKTAVLVSKPSQHYF